MKKLNLIHRFKEKLDCGVKDKKANCWSRFFLRIPLPAFYFDATDEDEWLIIDGLQQYQL